MGDVSPVDRCEEIDLSSLEGPRRRALAAELPGPRAAAEQALAADGATLHLMELHRAADGTVVAWALAQLVEDRDEGGTIGVLRVLTHAPRGRQALLAGPESLLVRRVQAWRDRHAGRALHLLTVCPDPATYTLVARQLRDVEPHWDAPLAAQREALIARVADAMGLSRVEATDDALLRAAPAAAALPAEQRYWQRLDSPASHFFAARTGDVEDAGLVVISALRQPDLSRTLSRLGRHLQGRVAVPQQAVQETRGRVQTPEPAHAARHLAAVPLLQGLPTAALDLLAQEALLVHVGPGQPVVVAGQPAEGLYVVTSGTVQVALPEPDGGELVVDELSEGDVFGEIGLVLGGTCTATVRGHEPATLVRVGRETYERAAAQHAAISEALWQAAGQRLLTNRLLDDSDGEQLGACVRAAAESGLLVMDEPEPLLPGHYFLVHGEALVEVAETWFTATAGSLFRVGAPGRLTPRGGAARLLAYPPVV